ncbi:hypothetical protein GCM10028807_52320 [Spirosoma daeguense]
MEFNIEMIWPLIAFLLAGAMSVLGVFIVAGSYKQMLFYQELNRRGQTVIGKIVRIRTEYSGSDSSNSYYPVFSYQVNGQDYEIETHSMFFESFTIGQEMPLRFLPENPAECTWRKTLTSSVFMLLVGIFCAFLGVLCLYRIGVAFNPF